MARDKYKNSPANDDWYFDDPVDIYSKDSRPKTPKTPKDPVDSTSRYSYDDFDTADSGSLDVYKTLTFTHRENPAGDIIYVQVDGKQVPVTMPVRLKNGDTVVEHGMGRTNSRTGKRGDLHITVFFRSRPFPIIPLILCAVLVPLLIAWATGLFDGGKDPRPTTPTSNPDSGYQKPVDQPQPDLPPIQTTPADQGPVNGINQMLSFNPYFIGAGGRQTAMILDNGTVIAEGEQRQGACNVSGWTNVQMISSGDFYTIGLRYDGVVVATGDNAEGQCNMNGWQNISFVTAGDFHSVAITTDDEVVAVGRNDDGQCNVNNLKYGTPVAVAAGFRHTVVLYADGTVDAIGSNHKGQCDVDSWRNVVAVYCGANFTLGLCADGTVLATGDNADGQCDARNWSNVKLLAAGDFHSVAVTHDGRILTAGQNAAGQLNVYNWSGYDIFALGAGCRHTVAVKEDGTILATGENDYGQCDVRNYSFISSYNDSGSTGGGTHNTGGTHSTGGYGGADYANARVGDVIRYGTWEQDDNYTNGADPIDWIVLEKRGDRMLVISKYALENISFHNYSENVVWENCDLRAWLNNDFYQGAFTWEEQRNIILATVPAHENPFYNHGVLYDTQDYVFILSPLEAEKYFPARAERICYPSRHTQNSRGVWLGISNSVWWWLRTPGEYADDATCVNSTGDIAYTDAHVSSTTGTVRPVMWLSIP